MSMLFSCAKKHVFVMIVDILSLAKKKKNAHDAQSCYIWKYLNKFKRVNKFDIDKILGVIAI